MNRRYLSSEGLYASLFSGACLGFGYALLLDDRSQSSDSDSPGLTDAKLKSSIVKKTIGGSMITTGFYFLSPAWLRQFWASTFE